MHKSLQICFLIALLGVCGLSACGDPSHPTAERDATAVLHIFSGRPDPEWRLNAEQLAELESLLESLPEDVPHPEPQQLGYRGFALHLEPAGEPYLRAFNGVVRLKERVGERWLSDPGRSVEHWLLASGEETLEPSLLEVVEEELAPKSEDGTGELAIYLTTEEVAPADLLGEVDLAALPHAPYPLITQDDILAYDVTSHTFTLRPEVAADLSLAEIPVSGLPFVLYVGEEPIYAGAFWTPLSSLSFDGVVIEPWLPGGENAFHVTLGYPGPDFFEGEDPRADPRLLAAISELEK
ncbi:MAG: hypothetical protein ACLFU8_03545 [Anaerolineales bacterium]